MNDKIDPVVAIAKLLGIFMTVSAAEALAPQLGVFIAGAVGGIFGCMAWRKCTRFEATGYVLLAASGAWFFATSVAWAISSFWPFLGKSSNLSELCAVTVGMVGHRWPAVFGWIASVVKTTIESFFAKKAQ